MKSKVAMLVASLVFVAGLAIYVNAKRSAVSPFRVQPFVVTYSYHREGTDASKGRVIIVKVTSTGKSKTFQYQLINDQLQAIPEEGLDEKLSTIQYSPEMWAQFSSEEVLQSSPTFVRQDEICGFKTYVLRYTNLQPTVIESWHAPQTGPIELKTVIETGDGRVLISEATKIEFREVLEEELK